MKLRVDVQVERLLILFVVLNTLNPPCYDVIGSILLTDVNAIQEAAQKRFIGNLKASQFAICCLYVTTVYMNGICPHTICSLYRSVDATKQFSRHNFAHDRTAVGAKAVTK